MGNACDFVSLVVGSIASDIVAETLLEFRWRLEDFSWFANEGYVVFGDNDLFVVNSPFDDYLVAAIGSVNCLLDGLAAVDDNLAAITIRCDKDEKGEKKGGEHC